MRRKNLKNNSTYLVRAKYSGILGYIGVKHYMLKQGNTVLSPEFHSGKILGFDFGIPYITPIKFLVKQADEMKKLAQPHTWTEEEIEPINFQEWANKTIEPMLCYEAIQKVRHKLTYTLLGRVKLTFLWSFVALVVLTPFWLFMHNIEVCQAKSGTIDWGCDDGRITYHKYIPLTQAIYYKISN